MGFNITVGMQQKEVFEKSVTISWHTYVDNIIMHANSVEIPQDT